MGSGFGVVFPILRKYAVGVALGIVKLPRAHCPEKRQQTDETQQQRNRDQDGQDIHGYFRRRALSETVIDDSDIAAAAASGVAIPIRASGTAITL